MVSQPFFPNLAAAIAFIAILALGLAGASWLDWKRGVIPKQLTVSLLGIGLLLNVVRGGWVAGEGFDGWLPSGGMPALGALDGFLFALTGFLVGFALFFALWIFNVAGGGDVKLAAAIGGWFGPVWFLGAVALALPFLMLIAVLSLGYRLMGGKLPRSFATAPLPGQPKAQRRFMSYALPLSLGAYLIEAALLKGYLDYLNGVIANPG